MAPNAAIPSAVDRVQTLVIGAGAVGLATARALAQSGREVLLIERHRSVASETSSRNSEVIHAGLYYPAGSLKARFCVRGKRLLYDYCRSRSIPFRNCGKLIVSTNELQQNVAVPMLQKQATASGVRDTRILTDRDVRAIEPELRTCGALLSPSTGVIDSHSFFLAMLADAEHAGATTALQSHAQDAHVLPDARHRDVNDNHSILVKASDTWIACKEVVNCAGLSASHVASLFHSSDNGTAGPWQPPKQYYAKGNYFRLASSSQPFDRLVYPIPEKDGLGVHATVDYARQSVKFGPDVEWTDPDIEPDAIDLSPNSRRIDQFYDEIRKYWPDLPDDSLVPDYCGVRPKLGHPAVPDNGNAPVDFQIATHRNHGVRGLVHLFGIESPGLTSSLAIAEYVAQHLTDER